MPGARRTSRRVACRVSASQSAPHRRARVAPRRGAARSRRRRSRLRLRRVRWRGRVSGRRSEAPTMFGFGGSSNDRIAITFDNEDARPKKKLSNNAVAHPVFANIEPVTGAPRARDARRTSAAGTLSPQASSRSACPRASGSSTRASRSRSSARRAARARCSFVCKTRRPPRADRALLRPRQFLRFYVHPPRARHARRAVERHPARPPRPRCVMAALLDRRPPRYPFDFSNAEKPYESYNGQQKRAKFPTSKAHISAVFHSFWLIFGRAIISRNALEAWMLFPERARAEHSR